MPYNITVDTAEHVVRVLVSGNFDAEEAPRMTSDARAAAAESRFNILYDIRGACAGRLDNTDVFWMPRTIPALKDPKATRVRVATVFAEKQRTFAEFWETAFRNVGLNARAFDDEAAALTWLRG